MNDSGCAALVVGCRIGQRTYRKIEEDFYGEGNSKCHSEQYGKKYPGLSLFRIISRDRSVQNIPYFSRPVSAVIGYELLWHIDFIKIPKIELSDLEIAIKKYAPKLENFFEAHDLKYDEGPALYLCADAVD